MDAPVFEHLQVMVQGLGNGKSQSNGEGHVEGEMGNGEVG